MFLPFLRIAVNAPRVSKKITLAIALQLSKVLKLLMFNINQIIMEENILNDKKYDALVSLINLSKANYALNNTAIDLLIDIKSKLYNIDNEIISNEANELFKQYQNQALTLLKEVDN